MKKKKICWRRNSKCTLDVFIAHDVFDLTTKFYRSVFIFHVMIFHKKPKEKSLKLFHKNDLTKISL